MEIFALEDSNYMEMDSIDRGYRSDIIVKTDNKFYSMNIYTIERLQQDFESEVNESGCYLPDSNFILVKSLKTTEIIKTIIGLYQRKYFTTAQFFLDIDVSKYEKIYNLEGTGN